MNVHSVSFKKVVGAKDRDGNPCSKAWLNAKLAVQIGEKSVDLAISALYINKKRIAVHGKGCVPPKILMQALSTAEGIFKAVNAEKANPCAGCNPNNGNYPEGVSDCSFCEKGDGAGLPGGR